MGHTVKHKGLSKVKEHTMDTITYTVVVLNKDTNYVQLTITKTLLNTA